MRRPRHRPRPLAAFSTSASVQAWRRRAPPRISSWLGPTSSASGWRLRPAAQDRVEAQNPHADPEARPDPRTLVIQVEARSAGTPTSRAHYHRSREHLLRLALHREARFETGPVRRPEKKRPAPPVLSPADRRSWMTAVQPIEEDSLKAALDRLGQAIVGSRARRREMAGACQESQGILPERRFHRSLPTMITRRQTLQLLRTAAVDTISPRAWPFAQNVAASDLAVLAHLAT